VSASLIEAAAIGFAAGYLSGQFGIGGGIVTTPAIRLLLGYPELIAVGTPLPVIVPTAVVGAVSYARRGLADVRTGLALGVVGGVLSVPGAWLATRVGGDVVLVATAALIAWMAVDMAILALRPPPPAEATVARNARTRSWVALGVLGAATGLYSGFLGLGGGFVIVPALVRYFGFSAKRAVGTSLVALPVLAVPGSIAHYVLGNIDVPLALALMLGVVPGALLGAKVTAIARERTVRLGFAALLVVVATILGASELGLL
jgi:hypothetical protein